MSTISIDHVSKRFGDKLALDDVSLDVKSGELIALLGSSGCGKTTLLRAIAGLNPPSAGRILFDDRDMTDLPTRLRPIGMVFQSYSLFPNMTVRQNIGFPLVVRGQDPKSVGRRVDELLALIGLGKWADQHPAQLSGGQQQRTALARALAPAPAVLLLDEPLSALDAVLRLAPGRRPGSRTASSRDRRGASISRSKPRTGRCISRPTGRAATRPRSAWATGCGSASTPATRMCSRPER